MYLQQSTLEKLGVQDGTIPAFTQVVEALKSTLQASPNFGLIHLEHPAGETCFSMKPVFAFTG